MLRWLADRPLAQKFVICIGLMAVVAAGLTVLASARMAAIAADGRAENAQATLPLQKLDQITLDIASVRAKTAATPSVRYFSGGQDVWLQNLQNALDTAVADVKDFEQYASNEDSWKAIDEAVQQYVADDAGVVTMAKAGDTDGVANLVMGKLQDDATAVMAAVGAENQALEAAAVQLNAHEASVYRQAEIVMWVVFAVAVLLVVLICAGVVRPAVRTSKEVQESIAAFATATGIAEIRRGSNGTGMM